MYACLSLSPLQSRTSIGYETGTKPEAASPRGKPAAGSKRKAHADDDDEQDDGSDAHSTATPDDASSAASSPRPSKKKSRTGSKTAAGAAGRKSTGAAGKKGRGTRHVSEDEEDERSSRGSSVSRDEEMTRRDTKSAAAKPASTMASQPASRRASTAAAPAAAAASSAPFMDPSLFGPTPAASAASSRRPSFQHDTALEDAEQEEEEAEEDTDQPMRSPSPSPSSAEGKFEEVSAPAPTVPNPFQSASPTTSPQPVKQPSAVQAAAARLSSGGAKGSLPDYEPRFVSAASLVPTPFTQARQSLSPRPPATSPFAVPAPSSASQSQSQQPTGLSAQPKFNPSLSVPSASASFAFSPATSAVAGFQLSPPQPQQQQPQARRDDEFGLGSLPSYAPPSQRRATMPSPASSYGFDQQQEAAPHQQQRRYSAQYHPQSPFDRQQLMESKYTSPGPQQQGQESYEYEQTPQGETARDAEGMHQRRRYSDHVPAEAAESDTAGFAPVNKEKPASFVARARHFLSSVARFLLRTLLIGLMVATVGMVLVDGRLWRFLTGPPPSLTVFCPSKPREPLPTEFPPGSGQMICQKCPPHGWCENGKLTCVDTRLYVREGDECVLNDQAHRDAIKYKERAIDLLEKHVGRVQCGDSDVRPGTARSLSEPDLKAQMQHELQRDFDPDLWTEAFHLLEKESAPIADRDLTNARVLAKATRLGMEFEAASPQFSLACSIWMMLTNWMGHIIAASMIISIISQTHHTHKRWRDDGSRRAFFSPAHRTQQLCLALFCVCSAYLWFQFRRNQWRRSQVPIVVDEVCARLMHSRDHGVMVGGDVPAKPLAIVHLRDEYLAGHMSRGAPGDPGVWDMVVKRLAKDTRIEKVREQHRRTN